MIKSTLIRLLLVFLLLPAPLSASPTPSTPSTVSPDVARALGRLYVCYNGRICPLATMASDLTRKCYGRSSFMGLSAEQVMAGWLFYYDEWARPGSATMMPLMGNEEKITIVNSLSAGESLLIYPVWEESAFASEISETSKTSKLSEISENSETSETSKISENSEKAPSRKQLRWYSPADRLPASLPLDEWTFIRKSLNLCAQYLYEGHEAEALHLLEKMRAYQQSRAGEESLPSSLRFEAELLYLRLPSMRVPAIICLLLGLAGYVAWMCRARHSALRLIALLCSAGIALYLSFFLGLRWVVSGHMPLASGFETMTFLGWIAAVGGVANCASNSRLSTPSLCPRLSTPSLCPRLSTPSLCLLICGLSLLVASMGMSNPQITPLAPVLASPLLCLHVVVIMIAYALLAVVCLNGIAALLLTARQGRRGRAEAKALQQASRRLLAPALALLAGGIFVGAIWANRSWGTYWSWDPKETWALITLLLYSFPLHAASMPRFRRPRFFHAYMALAFIAVLITYFGVNFLLGGMHSYGR